MPIAAGGEHNQEHTSISPNIEQSASFNGLTVWLIDNDKTVLQALAKRLQTWGCDVKTATNKSQLEALKENKPLPMLIIADYHLDDGVTGVTLWTNADSVIYHVLLTSQNTMNRCLIYK